jgi:hypothetical protein
MVTLREKIHVEWKVRELLRENDIPLPDEIEYGVACVRLLWTEQKICLVVDIDPETGDLIDPDI